MDQHSRYNPKPDNARQVALKKVVVLVDTLLTDSDTERPADDGLTCGALREAITLLGGLLPVPALTPAEPGLKTCNLLFCYCGKCSGGARPSGWRDVAPAATGSNGQNTHGLVGGGGGGSRRVGMPPELGMGYGAGNEGGQPSPYSAALTHIAFDDAVAKAKTDFEAIDTAHAFDELEAWIAKSPGARSCWAIDKLNGKWRVGLSCGDERFSAGQDAELRGAIRNALMIAKFAGCL